MSNWMEQVANLPDGTEVATWDGGNDAGSVQTSPDIRVAVDDAAAHEMCDALDDALGYGSWAGSWQSSGVVTKVSAGDGAALSLTGNLIDYEDYTSEVEEKKSWKLPNGLADIVEIDVVDRLPAAGEGGLEEIDTLVEIAFADGPVPDKLSEAAETLTKEVDSWLRAWYEDQDNDWDQIHVGFDIENDKLEVAIDAGYYRAEDVSHYIELEGAPA